MSGAYDYQRCYALSQRSADSRANPAANHGGSSGLWRVIESCLTGRSWANGQIAVCLVLSCAVVNRPDSEVYVPEALDCSLSCLRSEWVSNMLTRHTEFM